MPLICIASSVAASIIVTKILVTHYFDIVDDYVTDMCDATKKFTQDIRDEYIRAQNLSPKV